MGKDKVVGGPTTPEAWAIKVTRVLDAVLGAERFPVRIADVAREYSIKCYPDDPIERIHGESLSGFDGALLRMPGNKRGWTLLYNSGIQSPGRINFTQAHEFGHYLVHRARFPDGIRCTQDEVARFENEYKVIEAEANTFAAYLLMPLNDFRKQVGDDDPVTWDVLSSCATRYEVSLVSATLRWLEFTRRRAMLVVSRDGFVLWAKPSKRAVRTGIYMRTRTSTIPVPSASPAATPNLPAGRAETVEHGGGVWFPEPLTEGVIRSDAYDFTMSLLQFGTAPEFQRAEDSEEDHEGMVSISDFVRSPFSRTP